MVTLSSVNNFFVAKSNDLSRHVALSRNSIQNAFASNQGQQAKATLVISTPTATFTGAQGLEPSTKSKASAHGPSREQAHHALHGLKEELYAFFHNRPELPIHPQTAIDFLQQAQSVRTILANADVPREYRNHMFEEFNKVLATINTEMPAVDITVEPFSEADFSR